MITSFQLNSVINKLKPSPTLSINEVVNRMWRNGEQVFHMGFGESRFNVNPTLQQALATHADKKSYLPAQGLPELTKAVANYYSHKLGNTFAANQVIVGPGSKLLIYGLQTILRADVFLPTPSWVSYAPQATLVGNDFFYIPSTVESDYELQIAALDKLVQASDNPRKLLIINSPNNPTGQMLSGQFLQDLANYCRANKLLVLSDEIYSQVTTGEVEHISISNFYPEGTFVLGGLSKHLSIGGWRLGVALLPNTDFGHTLMKEMVLFASETWSAVSAPIQYAAMSAYSLAPTMERYIADCRSIHGIRTRYFRRALSEMGIICSRAEGAFYIAANFDRFADKLCELEINTSAQLAAHLLEKYRIASLPGSDFGIPQETLTLRLSTSYLDMETSEDAQRIFDLYKKGIATEVFMSEDNHPVTQQALSAFRGFAGSVSQSFAS